MKQAQRRLRLPRYSLTVAAAVVVGLLVWLEQVGDMQTRSPPSDSLTDEALRSVKPAETSAADNSRKIPEADTDHFPNSRKDGLVAKDLPSDYASSKQMSGTEGSPNKGQTERISEFPVSPSVKQQCAERPIPGVQECKAVAELLRRLASEPRDDSWAARTEKNLRDYVTGQFPDAEIRSLMCETSLCAIEVALLDGHLSMLKPDEEATIGLHDYSHFALGFEPDPSGAIKRIYLRVYHRRTGLRKAP